MKGHKLPEVLPRHIAIILDGNGRWAKKRALPRSAGHLAGAENFRKISEFCRDIGIEYLTVYAFSTENWKRSAEEIGSLMELFAKYLREAIRDMEKNRVRIRILGDLSPLTQELLELIEQTHRLSAGYDRHSMQICINYGSRDEIVRAVRKIAEEKPREITEAVLESFLDTAGIPDPDICIRPSGELRLSNFMLWQLAYSELAFCDKPWPSFGEKDLVRVLWDYAGRDRRFGGR